jgi:hypothetical protein
VLALGCSHRRNVPPDGGPACGCEGPGCGCVEADYYDECTPDGECGLAPMTRCVEGVLAATCGNGTCDCSEIASLYYGAYGDCPADCGCEPGGCPIVPLEDCSPDGTPCCAYDGECDPALPRRCVSGAWTDAPECPK